MASKRAMCLLCSVRPYVTIGIRDCLRPGTSGRYVFSKHWEEISFCGYIDIVYKVLI